MKSVSLRIYNCCVSFERTKLEKIRMENIKVIRNKEELEGTCYYEFQLGKFENEFWKEGSLYIDENAFQLILKRLEKYILNFNYYGVTVVHKNNWRKIITDFKEILPEIFKTKNYIELNKIVCLDGYYERLYLERFDEMKNLIYKMIEDVIIWLEENIVKYSLFSILGI